MKQPHISSTGVSKGSFKSYTIGFILSLMLTFSAFALVMSGSLSSVITLAGLLIAGVLQILVHLHYFLHLDFSSSKGWNILALIFTILIMVLFVGGSLWIILDLKYRMM